MKRRRQRGITLTELMVALAIGLLVMLLAAALLVSANAAFVSQVETASVDNGGRYAIDIIGVAARQASFVNWERDEVAAGQDPAAAANISGLDSRGLTRDTDGIADPRNDAVNGSDVLAVRFVGSGPAPDGDGSVISCAGFAVSAAEDGWSIFYVARNADGEAELRCKYRGKRSWGADAIVSGVDTFQVLYGLDTDEPPDGVANEYVSATALDALDAALVLSGPTPGARERERRRRTHWKRIASIRVALVLHSARPARADAEPLVFDLFGQPYADAFGAFDPGTRLRETDLPEALRRRERKLFSSTILLRNPSL